MSKQTFIALARKENPQPQFRLENGVSVQLSAEEYEFALEAWAEMRIQQDQYVEENKKTIDSAKLKLAALGLNDSEIEALLGVSRG